MCVAGHWCLKWLLGWAAWITTRSRGTRAGGVHHCPADSFTAKWECGRSSMLLNEPGSCFTRYLTSCLDFNFRYFISNFPNLLFKWWWLFFFFLQHLKILLCLAESLQNNYAALDISLGLSCRVRIEKAVREMTLKWMWCCSSARLSCCCVFQGIWDLVWPHVGGI